MGVLTNSDPTLLEKGTQAYGPDLYNEIERDCHAAAVIWKRKMALLSRDWMVEPGGPKRLDKKAADEVERQLKEIGCAIEQPLVNPVMGFNAVCSNLLDAVLKGYAVGEIMWARDGTRLVATEFRARPARRFVFRTLPTEESPTGGYELRMLSEKELWFGESVPARKFQIHVCGSRDGNPYGLGLGHRLFWPAWFKRQGLVFWLQYLERYASPSPVGKYPGGMPKPDQTSLLEAVERVANGKGGIIPKDTELELLQADTSGNTRAYLDMMAYLDEEMSKLVLGETLTTQLGDVGSLAAAETHNDVRKELSRADSELLNHSLNTGLVRWITELNFPGAALPRIVRIFDDPVNIKSISEAWDKVRTWGFKPSLEMIQKTFGEGWEEAPLETVQAAANMKTRGMGKAASFADDTPEGPEKLTDWIEKAVESSGPVVKGMVDDIRKLLGKATSLEDFRDALLDAFPKLDATAFAEVMSQALIAGHLGGRYDVDRGH
jgi:phage gp29-like protein